jgi:hypothetical protein
MIKSHVLGNHCTGCSPDGIDLEDAHELLGEGETEGSEGDDSNEG